MADVRQSSLVCDAHKSVWKIKCYLIFSTAPMQEYEEEGVTWDDDDATVVPPDEEEFRIAGIEKVKFYRVSRARGFRFFSGFRVCALGLRV